MDRTQLQGLIGELSPLLPVWMRVTTSTLQTSIHYYCVRKKYGNSPCSLIEGEGGETEIGEMELGEMHRRGDTDNT